MNFNFHSLRDGRHSKLRVAPWVGSRGAGADSKATGWRERVRI